MALARSRGPAGIATGSRVPGQEDGCLPDAAHLSEGDGLRQAWCRMCDTQRCLPTAAAPGGTRTTEARLRFDAGVHGATCTSSTSPTDRVPPVGTAHPTPLAHDTEPHQHACGQNEGTPMRHIITTPTRPSQMIILFFS